MEQSKKRSSIIKQNKVQSRTVPQYNKTYCCVLFFKYFRKIEPTSFPVMFFEIIQLTLYIVLVSGFAASYLFTFKELNFKWEVYFNNGSAHNHWEVPRIGTPKLCSWAIISIPDRKTVRCGANTKQQSYLPSGQKLF